MVLNAGGDDENEPYPWYTWRSKGSVQTLVMIGHLSLPSPSPVVTPISLSILQKANGSDLFVANTLLTTRPYDCMVQCGPNIHHDDALDDGGAPFLLSKTSRACDGSDHLSISHLSVSLSKHSRT